MITNETGGIHPHLLLIARTVFTSQTKMGTTAASHMKIPITASMT